MAKRPPSSGTSGRSSGGITGMTVSTIHSGRLPRLAEDLDQLQPLDDLLRLQLAGRLGEVGAQLLGLGVEVDRRQHLADRLGADAGAEGVVAPAVLGVEELLLGQELALT